MVRYRLMVMRAKAKAVHPKHWTEEHRERVGVAADGADRADGSARACPCAVGVVRAAPEGLACVGAAFGQAFAHGV